MPQSLLSKIDFYLIDSHDSYVITQFICKLIEKIYRLSHKISLEFTSRSAALEFDARLWSYREDSFIPHALVDDIESLAKDTPIVLCYPPYTYLHNSASSDEKPVFKREGIKFTKHGSNKSENQNEKDLALAYDVLIPMTLAPISATINFNRLIYIINNTEDSRHQARQLFRHYRDQGIMPDTHKIL